MNQEQNNLNSNNFNVQNGNEMFNNQSLNNQNFNNTFNQESSVNKPIINLQSQPMNTFKSGNNNNQNFDSGSPKKKNLGLIIGVVIGAIAILIITIIFVPKLLNKSGIFGKEQSNSIYGDTGIISEDFFIYEFSKIKKGYWDEINKDSFINLTNKEFLDINIKSSIGDIWGPLALKTTGFTENVKIGSSYYTLNLKNNDFLFINNIPILTDYTWEASSNIYAFVLGRNLKEYRITISIENEKIDAQMELNKWTTDIMDTGDIYSISAYYKIDDEYYLKIEIPQYLSDDFLEKHTTSTKEDYLYTRKDVDNLMNKIISLISLSKSEEKLDTGYFTINRENYKFDNGISINFNSMKLARWNSGNKDIVYSMRLGQPGLSIYRENKKNVRLNQWNGKKSYDNYLNINNYLLKEQEYQGKKFYIEYFSEEEKYEDLRGMYSGISFQDGDYWYTISTIDDQDPNSDTFDINNWFKDLTDGLLIFE